MNKLPVICGFNECSEAGNDVFVPAIFLSVCNLRCDYCMNPDILTQKKQGIPIDEIREKVEDLEAHMIHISGGEPTCTESSELINLLDELRSWGLKTSMSTNGTNHIGLREVISKLNYVAMDLKGKYELAENYYDHSTHDPMTEAILCKTLLSETKKLRDDFDYEVRTTLYPKYIELNDIKSIGSIVDVNERWVLQQFRHAAKMFDKSCKSVTPYGEKELTDMISEAKKHSDHVEMRYV